MSRRLGTTLRRLRRRAGLSLKDVSGSLGVHLSTVSSWERGRSEPSVETLERLARIYGTEVAGILARGQRPAATDGFRPLSPAAGEELLRRCEELRLAVCLARSLSAPRSAAGLHRATGIEPSRLAALAAGEARMRPAEAAALIRELGLPGHASWPVDSGDAGPLPAEVAPAVSRWLDSLASYLAGAGSRQ